MSRLLLALWLLQAGTQATGVVTGVVRSSSGTPSAGVRVYAVRYRDAVEAEKSPPALDSLTVTDAAGKYRLEIPPGRYHIASGSVAAPTYFPGTTDISAARVISVAANEITPGIDFGSFVPANRNPTGGISIFQSAPPGTGVLSGVLRYPDGKPASGIRVAAVPVSAAGSSTAVYLPNAGLVYLSVGTQVVVSGGGFQPFAPQLSTPISDGTGAYRLENLRPDTYYLVAGYADAPMFYPGTPDIAKAKSITTTNTSRIDALDMTVLPSPPGVSIKGQVMTSANAPANAAVVRIQNRNNPLPAAGAFGLPLRNPPREFIVGPDGTFLFSDVGPGNFTVEALFSGVQSQIQNVVVAGQPLDSLQFVLAVANVTGRILMEDGSPVPNPQAFADAIVTTVNDPNIISSTIFPITANGTFTRLHEGGEYRFYLRVRPEEYEIKSMRFGEVDLMKETLKITGKVPVDIEIRVAKRTSTPTPSDVRVSGTALNGVTLVPATGSVTLCCRTSGPVERFSAPIGADGSFEFVGIPPGKYTPGVQPPDGKTTIYVVEPVVDVPSQGLTRLTLSTTAQYGQITAMILADGSVPLPETVLPSIVFTGPMGRVRVVARREQAGVYMASVPIGGKYDVSVENLPEGFTVKSILGDAVPVAGAAFAAPVTILIERR